MSLEKIVETDVLVIGGGIAGCFAAIKVREQGLNVTIVDKGYAGKTGATAAALLRCKEKVFSFSEAASLLFIYSQYNRTIWKEARQRWVKQLL